MKIYFPILSTVEKAAMEGTREAGREILKVARKKSPTDTGDSDKSGFVNVSDLIVQVGFRSFVSMLQHENLDWQHTDGGEPKFLERAALEVDVERIAGTRMRRVLGD